MIPPRLHVLRALRSLLALRRGPEGAAAFRHAPADACFDSADGRHGGDPYAAMMERRGWRREGQGDEAVLRRGRPEGGRIVLSFAAHARDRAIVSSRHAVVDAKGDRMEQPDWEWADLWGDRLQFAARGALWEGTGGEPRSLRDLPGPSCEEVRAPCKGIRA